MAQRTELFAVTVPAGTAQASPQVTALSFPDAVTEAVEFIIPPGPSGLVGWQLRHSGQFIIPRTANSFFVMDDVHQTWALEDYPVGNKWQVAAYNTDIYDHTLQFIFHVNELSQPVGTTPPLIPIG